MDHTYEDEKAFRKLSWTWARGWDTKASLRSTTNPISKLSDVEWPQDYGLVKSICTPRVKLYYSDLAPGLADETKAVEEYVAHTSSKAMLRDARLHTQHLLGGAVFHLESQDNAVGKWQVQARHMRDFPDGSTKEPTGNNYVDFFYERVGGEWKMSGLQPYAPLAQVGRYTDVIGDFD